MIYRFILFLLLNFAGLALGGLFTSKGVASDWYGNINKAPWTPPGWVFGAAWTTIMICFSFYLTKLWPSIENKKQLLVLVTTQWMLNVAWNPIFFYYHNSMLAIIVISLLTILIGYILIKYWPTLKVFTILIAPYFIWLLIATSLNAYILFKN